MKKIFNILVLIAAAALMLVSCAKQEIDTNQFPATTEVLLKAYGPRPVVRGGVLRFVGMNLDQVVSVTIPGCDPITDIEVVTSGVPSEIRVTVPKDEAQVGTVILTTKSGKTIETDTPLSYIETIVLDKVTPEEAYPGEVITLEGDYLHLIHEVIFTNKVKISEKDFVSHDRYAVKVKVPAEAKTGKVGVGTIDETVETDEDILAALNVLEIDFTVKTAEGTVSGEYKAGETVTINGTKLSLVESLELEGATVTDFTATDSKITFTLPDTATDGEVVLVMASGVEVSAGSITTKVPVVSGVTPAPVKNGASISLTGSDLDLVTGLDFPNAAGVEFDFAQSTIWADVPAAAQEGDIVLHLANGKTVTADLTLVKPTITGFSANPAAAGSDVTIEGTDLDLVKAITFGGGIKVDLPGDATAESFTVAVPTAAETGAIVLNLINGTDVESEELAIDKPAGAYIPAFPEDMYSPGSMFIVEIENSDHLTGVQIDGADVNYIVSDNTLYLKIPDDAKRGSELTLVSDNGSVTYTMNIDPGDIIETVLLSGPVDNGNWQNYVVPGDTFKNVDMKEGQTIRFYVTPKDNWWQFQAFDGHWAGIDLGYGNGNNVNAGIFDLSEGFISVVVTQELVTRLTTLDDWDDHAAGYLQWENLILDKITYYEDNSPGTEIWTGPVQLTWTNGGRAAFPTAAFQVATPGQKLRIFYSQIDQTWGQAQINDGSWVKLDLSDQGIPNEFIPTADEVLGWFPDGVLDHILEITLTQDLLDHLLSVTTDYEGVTCSIIIQGENIIINKATIK